MTRGTTMVLGALLAVLAATANGALAQEGYATLNGGTTGGAGGQVVRATTGTAIHAAICNRPSPNTPLIVQVEGTIDHGNTQGVSGSGCNSGDGDDRIELKDVSNLSIVGTGAGALFDQLGIHVRGSSNIILQNLHVRNVKKSGSPTSNGGDAIGMESDVHNVWVDHCTLEASGGESEGFDGLLDMKANTRYVTLSYSILRNSGRGGLVGSSDSDNGNGPVTYHHNLYENIDSRVPLLRFATAHAYNNHYDGIHKSGMNPRIGGKIKAENNYFENAKDPIGTFYTNDMGSWDVAGNLFAAGVTWTADGDENHPAGPDPVSTTSIDVGYDYTLDDAACVPQIVADTAGANRDLKRSSGGCDLPEPSDAGTADDAGSNPSAADAGLADGGAMDPMDKPAEPTGGAGPGPSGQPNTMGPGTMGPGTMGPGDNGGMPVGGGAAPGPAPATMGPAFAMAGPAATGADATDSGCSKCAVAPVHTSGAPGLLAWLTGAAAVLHVARRSRSRRAGDRA